MAAAESAPVRTSDRGDRNAFRISGMLAIIGGVLLGAGAAMPWFSRVTATGMTVHRDAFQVGALLQSIGVGLVIVGSAIVLALAGVCTIFQWWRPNLVMPQFPTFVAGLAIASSWSRVFGSGLYVGRGMILCLIGLALGLAATILMLPTEHPATG